MVYLFRLPEWHVAKGRRAPQVTGAMRACARIKDEAAHLENMLAIYA